jgi:flavorubredoxin
MSGVFKAVKVTDRVYWVGAIDWGLRDFHGYMTRRGTTYNAFLILADRITLVDTVKAPFLDEMMSRIASVVDPSRVDFVISNHSEMDHTGCLPQVLASVAPEKTFVSAKGAEALEAHFGIGEKLTVVLDGEKLDLGGASVSFVETKMCHWPDSMFSYLHEDELLFSQDGFGMHLASSGRFADEVDPGELSHEAAKYYANILTPLASPVSRALEKTAGLGVPISIIAPDHGPIWRRKDQIDNILGCYGRWSRQERTNKAVIVYDTMWQSTARMARAICEGLSDGGSRGMLMPMGSSHRSDVATEVLDAGALIVGSPTINNVMFPTLADVLTYLRGLRPQGLIGAAFGSYGWGGQATKEVADALEQIKVELIGEPLRVRYVPGDDHLQACRQLGATIAAELATRYDA